MKAVPKPARTPSPGTVPRAVRAASILSYVSAGLAFIGGIVISLALQLPQVTGFVAGVLWLFMAATIRTRRPWMHVVATFLFGLGTLAILLEPLNELALQAFGATPDLIVFETVQWLPALGAVMLLWTLLTLLVGYALLFTEPVGPEVWVAAFSVTRWALALTIAVLVWTPESSRYYPHTSQDAGAVE
jgi:hypothetical protein